MYPVAIMDTLGLYYSQQLHTEVPKRLGYLEELKNKINNELVQFLKSTSGGTYARHDTDTVVTYGQSRRVLYGTILVAGKYTLFTWLTYYYYYYILSHSFYCTYDYRCSGLRPYKYTCTALFYKESEHGHATWWPRYSEIVVVHRYCTGTIAYGYNRGHLRRVLRP